MLSNDIYVNKNDDGLPDLVWNRGGNLVSTHMLEQVSLDQIPTEYVQQPYKFTNEWGIQLPKGYSALFTHPLNRTDLPFYTLSGVVDIDSYINPVHLPFFLRKDFEGVIEAGTPIAQLIPIKRERWNHKIINFDINFVKRATARFHTKIYRAYKNSYWSKKHYE